MALKFVESHVRLLFLSMTKMEVVNAGYLNLGSNLDIENDTSEEQIISSDAHVEGSILHVNC